DGTASLGMSDLTANAGLELGLMNLTIESPFGGILFHGEDLSVFSQITLNGLCGAQNKPVKFTVTNSLGSCWSYVSFKGQSQPVVESRSATVFCTDSLVLGGGIGGTPPSVSLACSAFLPEVTFAGDWIEAYECDPGVQDTVKVILREWEAFDKNGVRGVGYDTIVVLQFPEIDENHIYCTDKDTVYCGSLDQPIGPYITYDSLGTCDTIYLIQATDSDKNGILEFTENEFAPKCGMNVHIDYDVFASGCENIYKVTVELKQDCYGSVDDVCIVTPSAGTPPNTAEEIADGYWRCEFWLTDLDTLGPEVLCKGDELFSGPFSISNWQLISNPISIVVTANSQSAIPFEQEVDYFDLTNLPYQVIVNSVKPEEGEIFPPEEERTGQRGTRSEETTAGANGFYPYFADAEMVYEAEEDGVFDFAWDFTLEPGRQTFGRGIEETACVSVSMSINDESYRIVEEDYPAMCVLLPPGPNPQIAPLSLSPVGVMNSQSGILSVPLRKGDTFRIDASWISARKATFRILGPKIVNTSTHECAAHSYIPNVYVEDDWTGVKQVKAIVEGIGTYIMTYSTEDSCYITHEQVKFPKRDLPYKIIYEAYDSCHNVGKDSCYIYVKDRTRPVAVADKGITVSLSDKKVWVDAETFDEGSWDNCGVNFILARRSDWYEACINLCDSIDTCYISEHYDTLWQAILETDKHLDEVEAHYAKQLEWLCADNTPCGEIIYNSWKYDLMKYATLHCKEHPYEVTDDYFKHLFEEAIYYDSAFYYKFNHCSEETQDDLGNLLASELFGYGHHTSLSSRIDMYSQIGGGWSDAVPFSCEDACGPVTVEILVMDYWCNWNKAWTDVWVEDKTPVNVAKDVVDGTITCKVYKDNDYTYPGEEHPVSI
ncbi:MAG: hypothetical protein KDC80_26885, partial [Saprospiraceae bacterium]|nr:hypothetical protein [Saprospiraceae bacterium]